MNTYLDKLELHGFKSFPDKTIIKFHKGITAIIGPNGCGKSNIVDAVLWVLGEQKIKSLRGENNEDLIFNGSADKKPLGMTEVGAHFIKNYEPVHIARRYYRSSETKYILNQKYSRNKDIQNTLYDMQMGEKKYFIFEQGSIDKLVTLKAGEKRILIEEAAGVSKYLERKKETVNKLIIAEQNLESLDMLIFDKDKRLKELKNQVNYVQRYRTFKIEKINNLKALIQKNYNKIQVEVKKNIIIKDEQIKKESLILKEINSIEKNILKFEEEKWKIELKQKKLEKIKFDTNSIIISTQKEIEKSRQQQVFTTQQHTDIKRNITTDKTELEKIEPQLEKIREESSALSIKYRTEQKKLDNINTLVSKSKTELNECRNENQDFKSEIFKVQSQLSSEKNRINKLERTKFSNENEVKNKNKYLKEINKDDLKKEVEKNENELKKLKTDFNKKKNDLDKHLSTQKNHLGHINADRLKISDMENEVSSLIKQKEKYIEIKKKISDSTETNMSKNDIPLQDILKTDKINFKTIENFFFDEMESKFLKNNNIIPENKNKYILLRDNSNEISGNQKKAIINEKGFISFISDIYKLEEIKQKNSLKEGVIVDTLTNGINIFLKYGYGIITNNHEVITKNGIIIRDRNKGILNINQEINEAEIKAGSLIKKLNDLNIKVENKVDKYNKITSLIEKEQSLLNKLEKEIFQKTSSLESLKSDNIRNVKRIEILKKELLIIQKDNEELTKDLDLVKNTEKELKSKEAEFITKNEKFRLNIEKQKENINENEKKYLQQHSVINLIQEKIKSLTSQASTLTGNKKKLNDQKSNDQKKLQELSEINNVTNSKLIILKEELKSSAIISKENDILLKNIEAKSININEKIKQNTSNLNELRIDIGKIKDIKSEVEIILSSNKKDIFQLEDTALKELNDEIRNIKGSDDYLSKELYDLENEVKNFEDKLSKMRDSEKLNFSAESEYEILFKDHGFLITQKEDVINSIQDMHKIIEKIDSQSKTSFLKAYNKIKANFVENFKILFEGGDATLSLTDQNNLLETGLDIKAQPPGKQLLSLRLLSGGEKTLTSLAFLFALFQYKPAPFCIFDEVDASLDEANIQRFLKFLHILKKNTQFLIITHNFKTMEEADYLYGISMNEAGISTIFSTKFSDS